MSSVPDGFVVACFAVACCLLGSCRALAQSVEPGIARELARARRAVIESVAYELRFELEAGRDHQRGRARVGFTLRDGEIPAGGVVLDFAGRDLAVDRVNSTEGDAGIATIENHLRIPASRLLPGQNLIELRFACEVGATGTPITSYRDASDGSEYLYTLLVPADAHRLFPCFDQPDLKARFVLELDVPSGWSAVANAPEAAPTVDDPTTARAPVAGAETDRPRRVVRFEETRPLSTYLFAFAAGPFAVVEAPRASGDVAMRLFHRANRARDFEPEALFRMHAGALGWLGDYFDFEYPFGKLDIVCLPGFPYGGMEHAGAIFYRESALAFDHPPTDSERIRRSTLVYHEVSHQWFGNLVTMEWFDDLWLKEGFATFVAYRVLEALEPERRAWLHFQRRVKPIAYAVDATAGTTPVWQELDNLRDAKSAYGAIVYNKAPAVLRELEARLGADRFRNGVRAFLRRHAFGNARWEDLVDMLRAKSGLQGSRWSDSWILSAGMPKVRAVWGVASDGSLSSFAIEQSRLAESSPEAWPLVVDVLLIDGPDRHRRVRVRADEPRTEVAELRGTPAPSCVLLNPDDIAYGLFLVDATSRDYLLAHVQDIGSPLLRAVACGALFDSVREAELDPRIWIDLTTRMVLAEEDAETHAWLLSALATTLGRYLGPAEAAERGRVLAQRLIEQLERGVPGRALQTLRFLARSRATLEALALFSGLIAGDRRIEGVELGHNDRFLLAAALLAAGDPDAVDREIARLPGDVDVAKEVYVARAAANDASTKQLWFDGYSGLNDPPEQWMLESLDYFHWPGQEELTLRFLRPALDRVAWVKVHRKVFFMPAWIDAFVNAHSSPAALDIVRQFLADTRSSLEPDIRRKVLQSIDSLERAVRIRELWR